MGIEHDYTKRFDIIEEQANIIQKELLNLVQDATIASKPDACEKVFGLLNNMQCIRQNTKWQ